MLTAEFGMRPSTRHLVHNWLPLSIRYKSADGGANRNTAKHRIFVISQQG
jgi:hypothetical protein